jgi:hypothetical protein
VYIFIEMELLIPENGMRINNMDMDLKNGLMGLLMKVIILWV